MLAGFLVSKSALLALGQDASVVEAAYQFILMMSPSYLLIG